MLCASFSFYLKLKYDIFYKDGIWGSKWSQKMKRSLIFILILTGIVESSQTLSDKITNCLNQKVEPEQLEIGKLINSLPEIKSVEQEQFNNYLKTNDKLIQKIITAISELPDREQYITDTEVDNITKLLISIVKFPNWKNLKESSLSKVAEDLDILQKIYNFDALFNALTKEQQSIVKEKIKISLEDINQITIETIKKNKDQGALKSLSVDELQKDIELIGSIIDGSENLAKIYDYKSKYTTLDSNKQSLEELYQAALTAQEY